MSKLYVEQYLRITADTNVNCSSATTKEIRITKPDGTILEEAASVVDNTKLRVTLTDSDLDQSGNWKIQTYAVISAEIYIGETVNQQINRLYT